MRLRRRRSLLERTVDQLGTLVPPADSRAAKGGLSAVGGAVVLTALSAVVSAFRKRENR